MGDFPTDATTLDLLDMALHPGPESERTSLFDLLDMLAGVDPAAPLDEEQPTFHPNDVIAALITEVRRLRAAEPPAEQDR